MGIASTLSRRFKSEFLGRSIYIVSNSLLTVFLATLLEPEGYGLLFLALSVMGLLGIFSKLGIGKSTARYITEYKEDYEVQVAHILRVGFLLTIIPLSVVCVVVIVFHEQIAILVGEKELIPFLLLGAGYLVFSTYNKFCRTTLQGLEKIEMTAVLKVIRGVFTFLFAIGLVLLGFNAIGAFVGYMAAYALSSIIGIGYLYRYHYQGNRVGQIETGLRRRIAEYALPITVTSTASSVDRYVDSVLLGFFIGPAAVGFYNIGKQVLKFIETPANSLAFTVAPSYETQKAQGDGETAARIYEESLNYVLLLYLPAAAGIVLVADPLINIVFGAQYQDAVLVLQILSVYLVFHVVKKVTGDGLDFLGRARARAIFRIISAFLNLILNILLIPSIGVAGAAVALVISYGFYSLGTVYIMTTEMNLRYGYLIKRLGLNVLVTAGMVIAVYPLVGFISGLFTLLSVASIGILIWLVSVSVLGLVDIKNVAGKLS